MLKPYISPVPIIPSILVQSRQDFEKQLEFAAQTAGAAHLDVTDSQFCPGESLLIDDWPEIELPYSEAHLMVVSPIEYLGRIAAKKVTRAIVHIEAKFDPAELIETARGLDILLGYAINPDTDLEKLRPYLDTSSYVQVMGVHPGRSNQELIDQTPVAINYLLKNIAKRLIISVDGGVNTNNIARLKGSGANYFVAAHSIFRTHQWPENYQQLQKALETNDD